MFAGNRTLKLLTLLCITIRLSIACSRSCDECLSVEDFNDGTYRIRESGKYCLSEDIEFNPSDHWFPTNALQYPGCHSHLGGAYALGFFAAITIETDDVELDLNGWSIEKHLHHHSLGTKIIQKKVP